MKKYFEYINENRFLNTLSKIHKDKFEWIECPYDYEFEIGERVKMSPESGYQYQSLGNKIGSIVCINSSSRYEINWTVNWEEGTKDCHYWRKDLLINLDDKEEIEKKKDQLKQKYKDLDPFEEEKWID